MTNPIRITPTALSLTWPPPRYELAPWVDPFGGCPALWELVNESVSSRPRAIQIGDGILTRRSREEVERITQRLGGKMKP
jgi:hypothetical protein